jgi:hypothetical protein
MRTVILALALTLATPALAEDPTLGRDGVNLTFAALGHRFVLPTPDWLTATERLAPDIVPLVETNIYSDPAQAFVEFFPRGESVETWTSTYAARLTLTPGRSLDDYRRATMYGYTQICRDDAIGFFNFGEETETFFPALGMVCGAYRETGALKGFGGE